MTSQHDCFADWWAMRTGFRVKAKTIPSESENDSGLKANGFAGSRKIPGVFFSDATQGRRLFTELALHAIVPVRTRVRPHSRRARRN
jgi:hypothetical protein